MTPRLPHMIIIVLAAILLAVGASLAIAARGRPTLPRGTHNLLVEGHQVQVVMEPKQEVYLIPVGDPEVGKGGLLVVNTATPAILPSSMPMTEVPPLPTAPPPTVTPIPQAACIIFTDYPVQPGDTLFGISRRHVTSITLMAQHGISSSSLVPGRVIPLPVGDPACCSGGWQPYVVEEGDTWSGIAAARGITADALMQNNGRAPGATLYLASVICTP